MERVIARERERDIKGGGGACHVPPTDGALLGTPLRTRKRSKQLGEASATEHVIAGQGHGLSNATCTSNT
jgi:hypothetical protein